MYIKLEKSTFPLFQIRLRAPKKCLVAATCRSSSADEATFRSDGVTSVAAICRIVCIGKLSLISIEKFGF